MKRSLSLAFLLFSVGATAARALAEGGAGAETNRISLAPVPAYVVTLQIDTDIAGGVSGRELWRVVFKPVFAAEISLFNLLFVGVSVPFAIEAGYPFYGTHSLNGMAGAPRFDLGIGGRREAISFRGGAHFVIPGISGPSAGCSISVAAIRDPVALKLWLHVEFAPDGYTRRWDYDGGGCAVAVLVVLNEIISVELGTRIEMKSFGAIASPPLMAGRAGIYVQKRSLASFFFVSRDLWNPSSPASFSTGIAFSWGIR